jgi:hypothetical protein
MNARLLLFPVPVAAWLLLPGAAWAHGTPVNADGTPVFDNLRDTMAVVEVLVIIALVFAVPIAIVLALDWGAQAGWRAVFKTQPPFDISSVGALAVALLLAVFSVFVIPQFALLFSSFGAYLPWYTVLLVNYGYALPGLVILLLFLLVALKNNPRREGYFAVILVGELALLVFAVISMYSPIFTFREAVSG